MLRGIAALMVVAHHAAFLAGNSGLFDRSYLAVDFFFMLSGYVLARRYEVAMPQDFVWGRIMRFWPIMALGALLGLVASPRSGSWQDFALLLIFLPGRDLLYRFNVPAWSIFFELVANVVHYTVLRRMSSVELTALAAACFAIVLSHGDLTAWMGQGGMFALGVPRVIGAYAIGVILFRSRRSIDAPWWISPILIISALLAMSVAPKWSDPIFTLLVCPVAMLASADGPRPLVALGPLSFPLYALHWPVLIITLVRWQWHPFVAVSAACGLAAAVACADRLARRHLAQNLNRKPRPEGHDINRTISRH